jgi:uncharacterized membrane protein
MEAANGKPLKLAIVVAMAGAINLASSLWAGAAIGLATAAFGMLLVGLILHRSSSKRRATYVCLLAPPVVAMTAVLVFAFFMSSSDRSETFAITVFLGGALSVIPSFGYGVLSVIFVRSTYDHYRSPSFESLDAVLRNCGTCLVSIGATLTLIALTANGTLGSWNLIPWLVVCVLATAGGVVALLAARTSRRRRVAWYGRVLAGELPGWSVVPWDAEHFATPIRPLFSGNGPFDAVIVRNRGIEHGGPFRSADEQEPYALVRTVPPAPAGDRPPPGR